MSRAFRFNSLKTIQSAAFLLRREPAHRMNFVRLLKILYLAEREILAESGKPLTGSRVVAMRRGTIPQDVLDVISGRHTASPEWSRFFRTDRYSIEMTNDPGLSYLSKYVCRKLDEVSRKHDDFDEWAMVDETQRLPEWQQNAPGDPPREITLRQILEAVGRAADLEQIVADARDDARAEEFFTESEAAAIAASANAT